MICAMSCEAMREVLRKAPHGFEERVDYLGRNFGQLFGWIEGPDQRFLVDWLPEVGLSYDRPLRIVEIGTFAGSTARGLVTMTGGGQITCIDNLLDLHSGVLNGHADGPAMWRSTIATNGLDLTEHAKLIVGDSLDVGPHWDEEMDLLLVDGAHDEISAAADIRNFAKWIVPGGHCLVDDTSMPPVERACRAYFFEEEWETIRPPVPSDGGSLAVYRKRSRS